MRSDNQSLVSVIVPIYNAQAYLDQCLSSIRGQSYGNLEIICINDGSTDDSLATMRAHAQGDPRVRVIDKPNGGYGAACNRGIDEARGEWIAIVEPDDWIEAGMYGDMLGFAARFEDAIDVIKTPWWVINDWDKQDGRQYRCRCPLATRIRCSKRPFVLAEHPELIEFHPSIWTALYRKAFLDQFGIRFPEYPGAGWADNPFLIETLCQARAILYWDRAYYCYRADLPGSTRGHATKAAVRLPFDRWMTMLDTIRRLGISDPVILESHYLRGFMYAKGACYDDGADNPLVREGMRRMFEAMDRTIVLDSIRVSNARKRLFCEVLGLNDRRTGFLACTRHEMRERWLNIRALGLQGFTKRMLFKLTGWR